MIGLNKLGVNLRRKGKHTWWLNILRFKDHQVESLPKEMKLQIIGHSMCKKVYKNTKIYSSENITIVAVLGCNSSHSSYKAQWN